MDFSAGVHSFSVFLGFLAKPKPDSTIQTYLSQNSFVQNTLHPELKTNTVTFKGLKISFH